jgi:hypothetical protein
MRDNLWKRSKKKSSMSNTNDSHIYFVTGLYDRLPGYLTNVSVQTSDSMGVMEEHGYNRCEEISRCWSFFDEASLR